MTGIKIFISFSSKDYDFVRKLFTRIKAQPMVLWDYSSEGQEIPGSVDIIPYLEKRIDHCGLFLPVVTANSLSSKYTRAEVEYAMALRRTGNMVIIPLVEKSVDLPEKWPEPYADLQKIRYYQFDFDSKAEMENTIKRICQDVNVSYVPMVSEDPRLPFIDRFLAELADEVPVDQERTNVIHHRLQHALNQFIEAFESGDYDQASRAMDFFISSCEYEFPHKRFYYPYIVRALCWIACGDLTQAQEILLNLLRCHEEPGKNSKLDENVYGALGYVKQQQGCYKEAALHYREALKRDASDPAAATGVVLNEALSGNAGSLAALIRIMDEGVTKVAADRQKIEAAKAFAYATMGQSTAAEEIFKKLVSEGAVTPDIIINLAKVLVDLQQYKEGLELLEKFHHEFPDNHNLLHYLATLCFHFNIQDKANRYFKLLVDKAPNSRAYLHDFIQVLQQWDKKEEAQKAAERLLSLGLPRETDDFFRTGYANWVLGREDRARYDFERSGYPQEDYYSA